MALVLKMVLGSVQVKLEQQHSWHCVDYTHRRMFCANVLLHVYKIYFRKHFHHTLYSLNCILMFVVYAKRHDFLKMRSNNHLTPVRHQFRCVYKCKQCRVLQMHPLENTPEGFRHANKLTAATVST